MIPLVWVWMYRIMISDYRRGWEDALDVVLKLDDMDEIIKIRDRLKQERITHYSQGPIDN